MENLPDDLDCFKDENGQIENIYGEPILPERIQVQREHNRINNTRLDIETKL